jgi:hypothetical protein
MEEYPKSTARNGCATRRDLRLRQDAGIEEGFIAQKDVRWGRGSSAKAASE